VIGKAYIWWAETKSLVLIVAIKLVMFIYIGDYNNIK